MTLKQIEEEINFDVEFRLDLSIEAIKSKFISREKFNFLKEKREEMIKDEMVRKSIDDFFDRCLGIKENKKSDNIPIGSLTFNQIVEMGNKKFKDDYNPKVLIKDDFQNVA